MKAKYFIPIQFSSCTVNGFTVQTVKPEPMALMLIVNLALEVNDKITERLILAEKLYAR